MCVFELSYEAHIDWYHVISSRSQPAADLQLASAGQQLAIKQWELYVRQPALFVHCIWQSQAAPLHVPAFCVVGAEHASCEVAGQLGCAVGHQALPDVQRVHELYHAAVSDISCMISAFL